MTNSSRVLFDWTALRVAVSFVSRSRVTSLVLVGSLGIALTGCAAITTSPSWVGGGMAVTGPIRIAEQEAELELETRRMQPDEIAARHVLVMHKDSKSRPDEVTRTKEQALARARECLERIRGGADFTAMVEVYSDEPGASERGGDLGVFKRTTMVKSFSDAAFALKVGEVSEIVETTFGFHVIKRTR